MTFQNLRNSHQIYILHKNIPPKLDIGKVTNISAPVPKYSNNIGMYNDLVIDIQVDVDGNTTNFQKLPANSEIADFGNSVVVACNKNAMNSEILSTKQKSLDIINSIEDHKSIVEGCDKILQILNPEIAEKQKQELENKALREEIASLKDLFKEFINQSKSNNNGNNN